MQAMTRILCCTTLFGAMVAIPLRAQGPSEDDKKFLATASQGSENEIALSEVAEQKATNPAVKAFAEKMIKEHKQLNASMKPFAESWGVTPATAVDQDHQKELDKLNGKSGGDFDKEYIDQMVTDHADALNAFTKEAKDTKDLKFRATVLKGKTAVAAHKNMAYDLKKKL